MPEHTPVEDRWVPHENAAALWAYYLAVFSFIPITGIITGCAAVILGVRGRKKATGGGHALFAIIIGGIFFVIQTGVVVYPLAR
ncbi:MAG: lipopolysaccharide export LptBFGC system permease protein LptF [Kiritimatiellia bacterium]|jgi:lipopolysaccharide export LptBFGC system permease protein LptF